MTQSSGHMPSQRASGCTSTQFHLFPYALYRTAQPDSVYVQAGQPDMETVHIVSTRADGDKELKFDHFAKKDSKVIVHQDTPPGHAVRCAL